MSRKAAALVCSLCAAPAAAGATACANCNGRVIKLCGGCEFHNSPAKNYCDQCGEPLELAAAAGASPPGRIPAGPPLPQRPEADLPKTGIVRIDAPPSPAEANPPPIRRRSPHSERFRNLPSAGPAGAASPRGASRPSPASEDRARHRAALASLTWPVLLLAAGVVVGGLYWRMKSPPETAALRTARDYLKAMQARNYDAAYDFLSSASKENCALEEFKLMQTGDTWTFDDLHMVSDDGGYAVVSYRLKERDKPPEEDILFFQKEGDRWTRLWTRGLFNKIEDAFDRGNPDLMYRLARAAAAINPLDPLAQGYVCEGAYYNKLPEDTVRECRAAIALAKKYPSDLTPQSRYHLHALLGDVLKNTLKRYPEAIEEWTALLQFPFLGAQDQCEALLARGETRVLAEDFVGALKDYQAAAGPCANPDDQRYLTRLAHVLEGDDAAKTEAVALVQGYRMMEGQPTLREWGSSMYAKLKKRMHYADESESERETWSADYEGGTRYKVKLEAAHSVILTAEADLWTRSVHGVVKP